LFSGKRAALGRLSIVYDVAGKARIVGITNFWIQSAFISLHESIFSSLRKLETDGTFDQERPLKRLLQSPNVTDQKYYSFDLSAATDRLPITLQKDILLHLGVRGDIWMKVLDFS